MPETLSQQFELTDADQDDIRWLITNKFLLQVIPAKYEEINTYGKRFSVVTEQVKLFITPIKIGQVDWLRLYFGDRVFKI